MKKSLAYEYLDVGGPLLLQLRGTASGVPADAGLPNSITVVHTRRTESIAFPVSSRVDVPIPAGATPEQIIAALFNRLQRQGDTSVFISPLGANLLQISPPSSGAGTSGRSDIAVRSDDSNLDWALSPFPNMIEMADSHDPRTGIGPTPGPELTSWGVISLLGILLLSGIAFVGRM